MHLKYSLRRIALIISLWPILEGAGAFWVQKFYIFENSPKKKNKLKEFKGF